MSSFSPKITRPRIHVVGRGVLWRNHIEHRNIIVRNDFFIDFRASPPPTPTRFRSRLSFHWEDGKHSFCVAAVNPVARTTEAPVGQPLFNLLNDKPINKGHRTSSN
ncbi:hypothetical protein FRC20_007943 [Serendipita sp. 405]|nr:hypothetical protein FRC15_006168 [Serendipita sp. 397]KAG8776145.1 hypothetical protein FRC16_004609 [Serendipita sp. 398]KAG8832253.1 hypothetical protein FRC20_007943 [Serendipita sp. 405]